MKKFTSIFLIATLASSYGFANSGTISGVDSDARITIKPTPDVKDSFDIDEEHPVAVPNLPEPPRIEPKPTLPPLPLPSAAELIKKRKELEIAKTVIIQQLKSQLLSALKRVNLDNSQSISVAQALNEAINPSMLSIIGTISDVAQLPFVAGQLKAKSQAGLQRMIPLIKSIDNTIDTVKNGLDKVNVFSKPSYFSQLATMSRLAKVNNPYNVDLATAYALKKVSKDRFASADDISLSSTIKGYAHRFRYDSNGWVNALAGTGHIKGFANPKIYGVIAGYDKVVDNAIVGASFSYSKAKSSNNSFNQSTKNYELGLYSRFFILDNYELDLRANVGKTNGKLHTGTANAGEILDRNSKYKSVFASFGADYGYIFEFENAMYLKPFAGFNYTYTRISDLNLVPNRQSIIPNMKFDDADSKLLSLKAGVDFRKYISSGNYFYLTPAVEVEAIKNIATNMIKLGKANTIIVVPNNNSKKTYYMISSGAQVLFNEFLSGNFDLGIKANSKEQYYNGSIGLRYMF